MRDILPAIAAWREEGVAFAMGTVVGTWSSAPRQPGASMAVNAEGVVVGSVSGGCVEGAVYEECMQAMESGVPRVVRYGVSDDDAFAVGLTCGGILDIFIQPMDDLNFPYLEVISRSVEAREPVALVTIVDGDDQGSTMLVGPRTMMTTWDDLRLVDAVATSARGELERGNSAPLSIGRHGERRMDQLSVFIESFAPPPRLIVFGAIDLAAAVARVGKFLGFHVTVCDARPVFATTARFPEADEIVVKWPHEYLSHTVVDERTVICVLTHDPKFDIPLLVKALDSQAAYIGAMGSRRTHEDRVRRLREEGVSEEKLARLVSPIGLDLGARTPEETAISIAAEWVARTWGGSGEPLSQLSTPIHRELVTTGSEPPKRQGR